MGDRARRAWQWTRHRAGVTGAYVLIVVIMFIAFRDSEHQRDELHQSICNVAESVSNALFNAVRHPQTVADQERRQAILDQYEAELEAGTKCALDIKPVPPPGG